MKLKVPPVLILVCFGLLMYGLSVILGVGDFDFFGRNYIVKFFLIACLCIMSLSIFQFYRAKTTVDPIAPSKVSSLVVKGMYRYTRNPMYLGMLFLLIALGLYLHNAFNVLLVAGFVKYMNAFQIIPEEDALLKKFGSDYRKYCSSVRRWF
ncbi:MAG: isoprenylcysteine carboxylmethyltransferase family protein [Cellulophaga sp.]